MLALFRFHIQYAPWRKHLLHLVRCSCSINIEHHHLLLLHIIAAAMGFSPVCHLYVKLCMHSMCDENQIMCFFSVLRDAEYPALLKIYCLLVIFPIYEYLCARDKVSVFRWWCWWCVSVRVFLAWLGLYVYVEQRSLRVVFVGWGCCRGVVGNEPTICGYMRSRWFETGHVVYSSLAWRLQTAHARWCTLVLIYNTCVAFVGSFCFVFFLFPMLILCFLCVHDEFLCEI